MLVKGALLTEGHAYPQDILAVKGRIATQNYLISEVQKVYRLQGVEINDKHIEVIVRQMMRKVRIDDAGSSEFIMGSVVNRRDVMIENEKIQERIDAGETDLKLVQASQILLGYHQVQPGNRQLPVRCILPGNHPRSDRSRHQGQG